MSDSNLDVEEGMAACTLRETEEVLGQTGNIFEVTKDLTMNATGDLLFNVCAITQDRNAEAEEFMFNAMIQEINRIIKPMEFSRCLMEMHGRTTIALGLACAWQIFMAAQFGRWLVVDEMYE